MSQLSQAAAQVPQGLDDANGFERRFGGLRRLYGHEGAQRIFQAHVVVVGLGGVGSWSAEALARSGVGRLTLIDLDHVSESNINRQIHATQPSVGQSKVQAMRQRIAQFHPTCVVDVVDDFVAPHNWPGLLQGGAEFEGQLAAPMALIDACDQMAAKTTLAAWALAHAVPFVTVGAAGGKRLPQAVEVDDLSRVTHDRLLAGLRYRLRKQHSGARTGPMQVTCVFSRESVAQPEAACLTQDSDGSLNCHGYGSVVSVTATFGLCAAGHVLNGLAGAQAQHRVARQL